MIFDILFRAQDGKEVFMISTPVILRNAQLEVRLLLPGCGYHRSRYDFGGVAEQVLYQGHRYLSRETIGDGDGLGGVGIVSVIEWEDSAFYDETPVADLFPQPGVGLLRRTGTAPYQFNAEYPLITPFERVITGRADSLTVRTLPHLCAGVAVNQQKTLALTQNALEIRYVFRNAGNRALRATEFCHNFFRLDDLPVDGRYRLQLPYALQPKVRRGQLLLERDAYRLGALDGPTASSAFWVEGYEGLQAHWMRLTHDDTPAAIRVEDEFPVCRFYGWNNAAAFCPEVFAPIRLQPGEEVSYLRRYVFTA